jgi:copper chaperone CopZ
MPQKTVKRVHKVPARKSRSSRRTTTILWTCIVLIALPFCVLAWLLISSALDTGTPILGDRYKGDLDPSITKTQISQVETAVKNVSGVEKCTVDLATATLRVYAKVADDATEDTAKAAADSAYDAVTSVLDPATYFTQSDGKKMYDLEVHVYNLDKDRDSDSFVYVIKLKTSSMTDPSEQTVSTPIDADLAQQLRDDVTNRSNPSATPQASDNGEITLGGEEGQVSAEPTATAQ